MPYARGDYVRGRGARGDYVRGDPFIGGLVAGVAGKLAKKAIGWVARRTMSRGTTAAAGAAVGSMLTPRTQGTMPIQLGPIGIDPRSLGPGGEPGFSWGKPSKTRRRINPLNPKALRRALRRAEGFEKFAQRTVNSLYRVIDGRRVRTFKKRTRSS